MPPAARSKLCSSVSAWLGVYIYIYIYAVGLGSQAKEVMVATSIKQGPSNELSSWYS